MVVGLGSYLSWKYLIGGLLALHLVSSYVYLGNQPFWHFVAPTGRNLLRPLRRVPLRLGKVDFAPLVGIALVFLAAEFAERGLSQLYKQAAALARLHASSIAALGSFTVTVVVAPRSL